MSGDDNVMLSKSPKFLRGPWTRYLIAWLALVSLMVVLAVRPVLIQVAGSDITLIVSARFTHRSLENINLIYNIEIIAYDFLDDDLKPMVDEVPDYRPLPSSLRHATLYVSLEQAHGMHTISQVSLTRPGDSVYLIAKPFNVRLDDNENRQLIVRYGLPKQVRQADHEGILLHALREEQDIYATVRIYRGHARIQHFDTQRP